MLELAILGYVNWEKQYSWPEETMVLPDLYLLIAVHFLLDNCPMQKTKERSIDIKMFILGEVT